MIFVHGFVHCDPHPGNVLVRKCPRSQKTEIVLLDHGLYQVGNLQAARTQTLPRLLYYCNPFFMLPVEALAKLAEQQTHKHSDDAHSQKQTHLY